MRIWVLRTSLVWLVLAGFAGAGLCAGERSADGREPLYHEALRPQFHFTARYWDEYQLHPPNHHEGWLNDLNGLVYNEGEYHLFAQRWWSAWLHAVSTDLVHWTELRPAFGEGGRFGGTQSGGGVVDVNNSSGLGNGSEPPMIAFWSSTDNESQCISYSLDRGRTWTKYDKNPVLVHKYRDPRVFWYEPEHKWVMVLYGPSDESRRQPMYGFNGEENDAHYLHDYEPGRWICSAVRVFDDGRVVATDQFGSTEGRIDINRQNISADAFYVGAKSIGSEHLQGDIAEILVYDRPLSDDQTRRTLAALQAKWGLGESGSGGDIATEGLVLRLDAMKARAGAGGAVSLWNDSSGNGKDVAQSIARCMPKLVAAAGLDGHPVLRFDGGQFLKGRAVLTGGDDSFTMIALWRRDNADGSEVICEQNASTRQAGRRACLLTVCREEIENVYLLFESKNLLNWTKLDTSIADSFECPDMFSLPVDGDAGRALWVVVNGNGDYVLGDFDGRRFTPVAAKQKGDYGRNFYATMTFENMPRSDRRRIQLAWMRGWDDYPRNMPFNQQVTFPCELTLRKLPRGVVMCRYPIREIEGIYGDALSPGDCVVKPGENPLASLKGGLFDIDLEIDVSQSSCSQVVLNLRGNTVSYDIAGGVLSSVGSQANLKPVNGRVKVRVLMDRLSIETFGNGGEVSITNIAHQKATEPNLGISAVGGDARIVSLTVHKLKSIWR